MCARCADRPDTGFPEWFTCTLCSLPSAAGARHAPEWARLDGLATTLLDARLRCDSKSTYARAVRHFCEFCDARGVPALPATVGLLRAYIAHCVYDLQLRPSTITGRVSAISDWHRRQQIALSRAGFDFINPCSDTLVATLLAIVPVNFSKWPPATKWPHTVKLCLDRACSAASCG